MAFHLLMMRIPVLIGQKVDVVSFRRLKVLVEKFPFPPLSKRNLIWMNSAFVAATVQGIKDLVLERNSMSVMTKASGKPANSAVNWEVGTLQKRSNGLTGDPLQYSPHLDPV